MTNTERSDAPQCRFTDNEYSALFYALDKACLLTGAWSDMAWVDLPEHVCGQVRKVMDATSPVSERVAPASDLVKRLRAEAAFWEPCNIESQQHIEPLLKEAANALDGKTSAPCVVAPTLEELEKKLAQAEFEKQAYTDALRYRWLRARGIAWRDCYGRGWVEGEWAYDATADVELDHAIKSDGER